MASMIGQIVVPAATKVSLASGLQNTEVDNNRFSLFFQQLIIQNNGANPCRIGDVTTSATTGLIILAAGSLNLGSFLEYGTYIQDYYVYSALGTTIDFLYIK